MKLFLDTANPQEVREAASWGVLAGVTTNPSLMAKSGNIDRRKLVQEICYYVQDHISSEVVTTEAGEIVEEAKEISHWSPYVVAKLPTTTEGLKAAKFLREAENDPELLACPQCAYFEKCDTPLEEAKLIVQEQGIRTNATLIFSVNQALLAALAGAAYVSVFVGRLDDAGHEGMEVVAQTVDIFERYGIEAQVIAASIRHPLHVTEAALAGADIATMPFKVLEQMAHHPLTDKGLDAFLSDWRKAQK